MGEITYEDFEKVKIRVGKVIQVENFTEARKPSYRLEIDFRRYGIKRSSAQITNYKKEELVGRQVIAVVNFPKKQIANLMSETLTLGVPDKDGKVILLRPDKDVELGVRMF